MRGGDGPMAGVRKEIEMLDKLWEWVPFGCTYALGDVCTSSLEFPEESEFVAEHFFENDYTQGEDRRLEMRRQCDESARGIGPRLMAHGIRSITFFGTSLQRHTNYQIARALGSVNATAQRGNEHGRWMHDLAYDDIKPRT